MNPRARERSNDEIFDTEQRTKKNDDDEREEVVTKNMIEVNKLLNEKNVKIDGGI